MLGQAGPHAPEVTVLLLTAYADTHGTIEIDSAPGRTVMRVRLPVGSTPG